MNTTANKITLLRIILIPAFLLLLYCHRTGWAFLVFVAACVSDALDGYIARRYDQISTFGKFVDPLADKMLVLSAMCWFIRSGQMEAWVVAAVLFREFAVSGLRLIAAEKKIVIAATLSGKLKTICTMVCLGAMILFPRVDLVNIISSCLILFVTLGSGIDYFIANKAVFSD